MKCNILFTLDNKYNSVKITLRSFFNLVMHGVFYNSVYNQHSRLRYIELLKYLCFKESALYQGELQGQLFSLLNLPITAFPEDSDLNSDHFSESFFSGCLVGEILIYFYENLSESELSREIYGVL